MGRAEFDSRLAELRKEMAGDHLYIKGAFGEYRVKGIRVIEVYQGTKLELFCISTLEVPRIVAADIEELYIKED